MIWRQDLILLLPEQGWEISWRMVGYLSKGKRYSKALLPERKKELDELINRLDEEDNPVMVVVTLK